MWIEKRATYIVGESNSRNKQQLQTTGNTNKGQTTRAAEHSIGSHSGVRVEIGYTTQDT